MLKLQWFSHLRCHFLRLVSAVEELEEGCGFALILKHERWLCSAWEEGQRAREKRRLKTTLCFPQTLSSSRLNEKAQPKIKNTWMLKEFGLDMWRLPTLSSTTWSCIQSEGQLWKRLPPIDGFWFTLQRSLGAYIRYLLDESKLTCIGSAFNRIIVS